MPETSPQVPVKARRKNRGWIWFFVVVVVLTAAAITTFIVFNLRLQLKPDQLATAAEKWTAHGPKSYELHYMVKSNSPSSPDHFKVRVLDGEVIYVTLNGLPLEHEQYQNHSMAALLDNIRRFLEMDHEPDGPWTFTRALFDEHDGHLLWYVRRVMGSRERVEIEVKEFRPLTPDGKAKVNGP